MCDIRTSNSPISSDYAAVLSADLPKRPAGERRSGFCVSTCLPDGEPGGVDPLKRYRKTDDVIWMPGILARREEAADHKGDDHRLEPHAEVVQLAPLGGSGIREQTGGERSAL